MMHGVAGSAALIVLTLDSVSSIETRLVYIFLFWVGYLVGMALLSLIIIIPFRHAEYTANHNYKWFAGVHWIVTLFLGIIIIYKANFTNGLLI